MRLKEEDLIIPESEVYLGAIRTGKPIKHAIRSDLDTIILFKKYPKQVAGIRTYLRSPYFKFYWKEKTRKVYGVK